MPIVPLREEEVPFYTHIVADSDMDGLFGAAVLRAFRPEATVTFSHAAALRGGLVDASIDRDTVLVDLPFHPACGWYVDHHLTNRPDRAQAASFEADGAEMCIRDRRSTGKPRPPPLDWRTTFWQTSPTWVIWPP